MITATQCLKARALLGWSKWELAAKAGVSIEPVDRLEAGLRVRLPLRVAVRAAFEAVGIEFTSGEPTNARLRSGLMG